MGRVATAPRRWYSTDPMGRLGPTEILLIVAVVLLLFGGRKIADIGKGLGEGIKNFKKGITEPEKTAGELPPATEDSAKTQAASTESTTTSKPA
jgi:sec-independent protein translocase protein TatA